MSFTDTFRAFQYPNYRLFFSGQFLSRIGMWMQRTAVIWVVYSMTHSVFLLGLTTFAEQFPSFLLSPLGGITADRYNRYKVLMVTQVASAIQAAALTLLYMSNHHEVWMILSLSVLLGVANAFDVPARQPMVNDIITKSEDLPNAIAINSSLNNLARLIGPALSGIILAAYGAGICFAINAFSFIAVIASLWAMKVHTDQPPALKKKIWTDFAEGFQYVKQTVEIGKTLLLLALVSMFVASYNTLIPVYAKDIFKGNAATYGYLNAAIGTGAVISTLYIASRKPGTSLKHMLFINLFILGISLLLFSHSSYLPLTMVLAVLAGFGTMSVMPICNTLVQIASTPAMRGRVISFFAMSAFGMLPLGALLVGWISKWVGVQNAILGQGLLAILLALYFRRFLQSKTKIKQEVEERPRTPLVANATCTTSD